MYPGLRLSAYHLQLREVCLIRHQLAPLGQEPFVVLCQPIEDRLRDAVLPQILLQLMYILRLSEAGSSAGDLAQLIQWWYSDGEPMDLVEHDMAVHVSIPLPVNVRCSAIMCGSLSDTTAVGEGVT